MLLKPREGSRCVTAALCWRGRGTDELLYFSHKKKAVVRFVSKTEVK